MTWYIYYTRKKLPFHQISFIRKGCIIRYCKSITSWYNPKIPPLPLNPQQTPVSSKGERDKITTPSHFDSEIYAASSKGWGTMTSLSSQNSRIKTTITLITQLPSVLHLVLYSSPIEVKPEVNLNVYRKFCWKTSTVWGITWVLRHLSKQPQPYQRLILHKNSKNVQKKTLLQSRPYSSYFPTSKHYTPLHSHHNPWVHPLLLRHWYNRLPVIKTVQ